MQRLTTKKNGQPFIPSVPLPHSLSWYKLKFQNEYLTFSLQYAALVEKLSAYEDEAEAKCRPLEEILHRTQFPYHCLKDVSQGEWERLDRDMQVFDTSNQDYDLDSLPLLALILRELLSTPIVRERHNMMRTYVPTWVRGPRWKKLLEEYGVGEIRLKDI